MSITRIDTARGECHTYSHLEDDTTSGVSLGCIHAAKTHTNTPR